MSEPITIRFGALVPRLHEQLTLSRRQLRYLQQCADGLTHLAVGQFLSESEVRRARQRLMRRIAVTFPKAKNRP